jgi:hypothetical protein
LRLVEDQDKIKKKEGTIFRSEEIKNDINFLLEGYITKIKNACNPRNNALLLM